MNRFSTPKDLFESGVDKLNNGDPQAAVRLLAKAAAMGHAKALNELGACYQFGIGVETDMVIAEELFERAASLGCADAHANLGVLLLCRKDYGRAAGCFRAAADQGDVPSMNNLACMLMSGLGIARDLDMAQRYFQRAALAGHRDAQNNLKLWYQWPQRDHGFDVDQPHIRTNGWEFSASIN